MILITKDPSLSPLFAGSAGLAIWMLVCGVRAARRASENTKNVGAIAGDRAILMTTERAR